MGLAIGLLLALCLVGRVVYLCYVLWIESILQDPTDQGADHGI